MLTLYLIDIKTQLSDFITCNNSDHVMTLLTIIHTLHMFNRHQNTVTHTLGSCDNIYMLKWDCLNNDMHVVTYSIDIYSNSLKTKLKKNTSITFINGDNKLISFIVVHVNQCTMHNALINVVQTTLALTLIQV